jgi:hypothetical protein
MASFDYLRINFLLERLSSERGCKQRKIAWGGEGDIGLDGVLVDEERSICG